MYSDNLSKELRTAVQPGLRFRQFADVKDPDHNQRHAGAIFHWNVFSDVATAGGTLVETTAMPETNFTITQGTLTITEYGKLIAALFSNLFNNFCSVIIGRPVAVCA